MRADWTVFTADGSRELARTLRRHLRFEKRPGDNPWLDLLRCAAIGFVLARHGHRAWIEAEDIAPGWFDWIFLNGWIGVDLFFVLSGYLIARILIRHDTVGFWNQVPVYLWRRALRILPAYYAVLFLTVLGAFPLHGFSQEELTSRVLYHLAMLQDYFPSDINVVFWSLGAEIKFYLLAPLAVALLAWARSPGTLLWLLAAMVLASTVIRSSIVLDLGVPENYSAFWPVFRQPLHAVGEPLMLGVAVAVVESRGLLRPGPRTAGWILAGVTAVIASLVVSHDFMGLITLYDIVVQPLLIALLFAAAVVAAAALSEVGMPGEAAARVGARLAYALYLVHFALLPLSLALADAVGGGIAAYWAIFLGLSLTSAFVVHYLFEKPFLTARKTLIPAAVRAR